jgi:hypothetical protein
MTFINVALCCPSKTLPLKLYHIVVQTKHGNNKIVAMLGLDNNVVYLLLPCLAWTTMLYIYCCHGWCGQQCGIFTVAMLGLNNNVIYLLLPCFVRTTMWYIYCCNKAWQL